MRKNCGIKIDVKRQHCEKETKMKLTKCEKKKKFLVVDISEICAKLEMLRSPLRFNAGNNDDKN
jgi:hypothetical protein